MSQLLNRFGLSYFNDEEHFTQADWAAWGPKLTSLGIGWLLLTATQRRAVPESFIQSLIQSEIQPIIHIPARVGAISLREIAPILKSYATWGVRHVVLFDRPNMQSTWETADWSRGELVERFADFLLPLLHIEREVGLQPMLPPLEPGGDYWDTAFLEALIDVIHRRGQTGLLKDAGVSLYSWTYARPLDWGQGGPEVWPGAKPYQTTEGSENHIGFRIFEWYHAIIKGTTGLELPHFVIRGGHLQGVQQENADPLGPQVEIYEQLQSEQTPTYLRSFNFDAFQPETSPDYCWFTADQNEGPMAEAIIQSRRSHRKTANASKPKSIDHYALFPSSGTQRAIETWEKMAHFAMAVQPTFGFSETEASHAKKVTILAGFQDIPMEVQERLEDSGCVVSRIDIQSDEKLIDAITAFSTRKQMAGGDHA